MNTGLRIDLLLSVIRNALLAVAAAAAGGRGRGRGMRFLMIPIVHSESNTL